jgi:hypothetical protein
MGYNMWLSEDSHYTLGHRMRTHATTLQAQSDPEPREEPPGEPGRAELDHIDFLMETLARKLENTRR